MELMYVSFTTGLCLRVAELCCFVASDQPSRVQRGGREGGSQRLKVTVCEVAACEHFGDVLRGMRDGSEQNGKGKRGLLFHTN